MDRIEIVECPRDAMQGWNHFIETGDKIRYLNKLLKVGFGTLDFGSFVSEKAIPQMRDTADVMKHLDLDGTRTKLLAIVANRRGAETACSFSEISILGYPFSVSETFQQRNTNASISESVSRVAEISQLCKEHGKTMLIYISMGFGNPYGDEWSPSLVSSWVRRLSETGIRHIALADTVGVATPESISALFSELIPALPEVSFSAHLHSAPHNWEEKVEAAYKAGCRKFDSALKGIGGCPMAKDELVGNLATENLVAYFGGAEKLGLNREAFNEAMVTANEIFTA